MNVIVGVQPESHHLVEQGGNTTYQGFCTLWKIGMREPWNRARGQCTCGSLVAKWRFICGSVT